MARKVRRMGASLWRGSAHPCHIVTNLGGEGDCGVLMCDWPLERFVQGEGE